MGIYSIFGDFIKSERERTKLGLREAARLMGISPSYLSRLEAGEIRPAQGQTILKIARLYSTNMSELMKRLEKLSQSQEVVQKRVHEVMAADKSTAPLLQAFYRAAKGQAPEIQLQMFEKAVDAMSATEEVKRDLKDQFRLLMERSNAPDLPRRVKGDDGIFAADIRPRVLSRLAIKRMAMAVLRRVFGSEIPLPIPIDDIISKFDSSIVLTGRGDISCGNMHDGTPAILGLSRWSPDGSHRQLVIHEDVLDAEDRPGRRRANFTIAHEFFHCIEHLPLVHAIAPQTALARSMAFVSFSGAFLKQPWHARANSKRRLVTNEDWREWQANQFAAEILMPEEHVREAVMQLFDQESFTCSADSTREFADEISRMDVTDELGVTGNLADRFDVNPQAMAIRLLSLNIVVEESN